MAKRQPGKDFSWLKPIQFTGYYQCFENSFPVSISVGGIAYPSVEHAFQAAKVSDAFLKHNISKIESLSEVTELLKDVPVRPNWEEVKYATLEQLMNLKFEASRKCKDVLVSTGARRLVSPKDAMIGKILTKIRNEFTKRGYQQKPGQLYQ